MLDFQQQKVGNTSLVPIVQTEFSCDTLYRKSSFTEPHHLYAAMAPTQCPTGQSFTNFQKLKILSRKSIKSVKLRLPAGSIFTDRYCN
jgi:hypothetical protein